MSETLFSPYEVKALLHFYCIAEEHEDHPNKVLVYRPTIERLTELGLIMLAPRPGTFGYLLSSPERSFR